MSSVTDSLIFRLVRWKRTKYYLKFEAALAEVQADLGIVPPKAAVAIRSKRNISLIDMQEFGV